MKYSLSTFFSRHSRVTLLAVFTMVAVLALAVTPFLAGAQPAAIPPGGVVDAQFNSVTATTSSGNAVRGSSGSGFGVRGEGPTGVFGWGSSFGGQFSQSGTNTVWLGTNLHSVDASGSIEAPEYCIGVSCITAWNQAGGGGGGGGGGIVSVTGGTGILVSNPNGPAVNVSVNTNQIQQRVAGQCAAGSSIRIINANGTVTCESVGAGGGSGDITDVNAGNGILVSNPTGPAPTVSVRNAGSLEFSPATGGVQLINDSTSPGASRYYGTNSSGTKGFHALPAGGGGGGGDDGDWTISGNNVYKSVGNVGIGTSSSAYPLNVTGNSTDRVIYVNNTNGSGGNKYGIISLSDASPNGVGVSGSGYAVGISGNSTSNPSGTGVSGSGRNMGTYGYSYDNIGVYGQGPQWGGYFNGRVTATQYCISGSNCISNWSQAGGGGSSSWTVSGSHQYSGVTGNVGIGTSSPTAKLTVNGGATFTNGNVVVQNWVNASGGLSGSSGVETNLGTAATPSHRFIGDTNTGMYSPGSDILGFSTGGANRVTMSSSGTTISGNTSNGTSGAFQIISPSRTMTFDGSRIDSNYNPLSLNLYAANNISLANGGGGVTIGPWASPGNNKLYVNGTAVKPNGGAWGASSDIRLKDVKGSYVYGLNEIMTLNPIWFNYKENHPDNYDSSITYAGISAQEVKKVIPEAVAKDVNGYYTLDANPIHWASINAIKELKALFDGQSAEVEALKADNSALKSKVDALEVRLEALEATM